MPVVSVGLPVYNGARFLRTAIESVLGQTLGDLELIISDNGSTDNTPDICAEYAVRDERVRYVHSAVNRGAAENFNQVFRLASGRYFHWLAADDFIAPECLARCTAVLDARPEVVLACTLSDIVDAEGALLRPYNAAQALEQDDVLTRFRTCMIQDPWCHAIYGLIRRDALANTALMGAYRSSDAVLLCELALYGKFAEVPERLYFRRMHEGSFSYDPNPERVRSMYKPQARRSRALALVTWRHLVEHMAAIGRAPLSRRERLDLWAYVLRWAWWKRAWLGSELLHAAWRPEA